MHIKRSPSRHSGAFTLLEIMLVVIIIALLAGAAIFKIKGNIDIAKIVRTEGDLQMIKTQLTVYESVNHFYPTTSQGLKALVVKPTDQPVPKRWTALLNQTMTDGWNQEYYYAYPGTRSPNVPDLYSSGPDRIPGNDDDIWLEDQASQPGQ